jgi:predicted TIM-barrel fold metal-dependent hydrolase
MNRREFSTLWLAITALVRARGAAAEQAHVASSIPFPAGLGLIDAHFHTHNNAPAFYELLRKLDLRVVNICTVEPRPGLDQVEPLHSRAREILRGSEGRAAWCSTFDPYKWESPGFVQETIKQLGETFDEGAIAVKIWKSIGMEIKSKAGKYLMPDDPVFDPIFDFLETRNKTLYAHLADPPAAWYPPDPSSFEFHEYTAQPEWQMYRHPGAPSRQAILAARDRMLERHPKLRVVGCHLGSMEEDVDLIAKRFDLYPNFAVDTAGRVPYLMFQPREKVGAFLMKYQDRVLYGSDTTIPWTDRVEERLKTWQAILAHDWKFLATDDKFDGELHYLEWDVRGLALPEAVLRKIFHENARRWVPGVINSE